MQKKFIKTILYAAFLLMLIAAGYVIFFTGHMIGDKRYFIITAAAFVLVLIVFVAIVFSAKKQDEIKYKTGAVVCVVLIIFQVMSLPLVNLFSQTLPAGPRGTVYQFPRFSNSIAQNDVGLMMRYYLNGKTLYASEDYPKNSHNGFLFITDEYEFTERKYPALTYDEAQKYWEDYQNELSTITVQANPKLEIASFKICIYNKHSEELVLLKDEKNNWYFMTPEIYEEAFVEQH